MKPIMFLVGLTLAFVAPVESSMTWSGPEVAQLGSVREADMALNDHNQAMLVLVQNSEEVKASLYSEEWQPSIDLSLVENVSANGPQVALNNQGHGIAIWHLIGAEERTIKVATYSDGYWSAAQTLQSVAPTIVNLRLALNDAGNGVAIWTTSTDDQDSLQAAIYGKDGWQKAETISGPLVPNERIRNSQVVLNAVGEMVVVWDSTVDPNSVVKASYRSKSSGTWSEPTVISEDQWGMSPQVALNNHGEAIAVWMAWLDNQAVIKKATFDAGKWGAPAAVNPEGVGYLEYPSVALNNNGNALITWTQEGRLQAIHKHKDTWGQIRNISQSGWACRNHRIFLNDLDQAMATFNAAEMIIGNPPFLPPPSTYGFVVAMRDGTWDTPTFITPSISDAGLNQQGQAFILYLTQDSCQVKHGRF